MTSRPFTAQYRGRCYECPELIEVGDQVVWAGDGTRMVAHADCSEYDPPEPKAEKPPCPSCHLVHAGECW